MCEFILTKYDVSGIQSYIFATNRLQENVGASYNVTRILQEFLQEAIKRSNKGNGLPITEYTDKEGVITGVTGVQNEKDLRTGA